MWRHTSWVRQKVPNLIRFLYVRQISSNQTLFCSKLLWKIMGIFKLLRMWEKGKERIWERNTCVDYALWERVMHMVYNCTTRQWVSNQFSSVLPGKVCCAFCQNVVRKFVCILSRLLGMCVCVCVWGANQEPTIWAMPFHACAEVGSMYALHILFKVSEAVVVFFPFFLPLFILLL